MKWRDKRDVAVISTCHDASMQISSGYHPISKSKAVLFYNDRKKGIDLSDQLSSYYDPKRKSLVWCKKIALDVLIYKKKNFQMPEKQKRLEERKKNKEKKEAERNIARQDLKEKQIKRKTKVERKHVQKI
ncbi:unnamed protein product [Euphydryas editha]|uniref:Uncharacterized protein n=1 Tax=Euphydryas editha TaxID=104508 RepID=A0AAU9UV91_EUPED|nr:unnamed protein product [Euphydryas editha]